MITRNAEATERLKQLLDNIDDEIETHVRERDFFIVSLTIATKPDARLQAEQHVSTETEVIHILSTLDPQKHVMSVWDVRSVRREYEKSRCLEGMLGLRVILGQAIVRKPIHGQQTASTARLLIQLSLPVYPALHPQTSTHRLLWFENPVEDQVSQT